MCKHRLREYGSGLLQKNGKIRESGGIMAYDELSRTGLESASGRISRRGVESLLGKFLHFDRISGFMIQQIHSPDP